jgi:hypothetical protein
LLDKDVSEETAVDDEEAERHCRPGAFDDAPLVGIQAAAVANIESM